MPSKMCCAVRSAMFDSLQPRGLKPTRLPLSVGFYRQEDWSGLPCPSPGDLPDPAIEPTSPASPALAGRFFATEPSGKPHSKIGPNIRKYIIFPKRMSTPFHLGHLEYT